MAAPKRKSSKSKVRSRQRVKRAIVNPAKACPQCGASQQPHRACPACGYYRGRKVLTVSGE